MNAPPARAAMPALTPAQRIRGSLRLFAGEEAKALHFVLLAALLQIGVAIGVSTADSLFLVRVGAQKLPVIFILTPALLLIYVPIHAWLMARLGIQRLMDLTLGVIALANLLLFAGLAGNSDRAGLGDHGPLLFYAFRLYAGIWYIGLYTLLWNYVDSYFDILDAKRLYPLFSAGMAMGTILGGVLVTQLVRLFPVEALLIVWSLVVAATFPVLIAIRRRWREIDSEQTEEGQRPGLAEQVRLIPRVMRSSQYAGLLVLSYLAIVGVTAICEFQYLRVFQEGRSAREVASLFGRLYAGVNCLNLVVNLFLFSRLVTWLGVRNNALIQPIVYAVSFSYLLLHHGFEAALVGFVAYQGFLVSIDYNNQNFLFNALPARGKAAIRTFIEGVCEPVAIAGAGLFLLRFSSRWSPEGISAAGLGGACWPWPPCSACVHAMERPWCPTSRPPGLIFPREWSRRTSRSHPPRSATWKPPPPGARPRWP